MAAYMWDTRVYPSHLFVESCGAILFDLAATQLKVCLLHYGLRDQWLLPKGRRNLNETRQAAAVREVREESGYSCRLRPVTMATRAPSILEAANVKDTPRVYDGLTEPFMLEVRDLGEGGGVKLVWWFVAQMVRDGEGPGQAEPEFEPQFFECEAAMKKLTFQKDRDVLRTAIGLVESTDWASWE